MSPSSYFFTHVMLQKRLQIHIFPSTNAELRCWSQNTRCSTTWQRASFPGPIQPTSEPELVFCYILYFPWKKLWLNNQHVLMPTVRQASCTCLHQTCKRRGLTWSHVQGHCNYKSHIPCAFYLQMVKSFLVLRLLIILSGPLELGSSGHCYICQPQNFQLSVSQKLSIIYYECWKKCICPYCG